MNSSGKSKLRAVFYNMKNCMLSWANKYICCIKGNGNEQLLAACFD